MVKDILIYSKDGRYCIAVLEDGELAELHVENDNRKSIAGSIYRGRVERVIPGMQAAFVDIGLKQNAYLNVNDVFYDDTDLSGDIGAGKISRPDISDLLRLGNEITVQVIKDAIGAKGPRVTANISLPGRYAVLLPGSDTYGVSKKIEDMEVRKRLKETAAALKPENCGIILRTAARDAEPEQVSEDIRNLLDTWEKIKQAEGKGRVPRLLYSGTGEFDKTLGEHLAPGISRIIVNDMDMYERLTSVPIAGIIPQGAKVELYTRDYDMFAYYNVQSAVKEALSRKVWLKSGGYLVFDYTEALTVIDVNSGKYTGKKDFEETAFSINMEAAEAIARQVRLRNLSGIIIIDFIDMKHKEHREQVVRALKNHVKPDRIKTVVLGMTQLGLVEMTRKKVKNPLHMTVKDSLASWISF